MHDNGLIFTRLVSETFRKISTLPVIVSTMIYHGYFAYSSVMLSRRNSRVNYNLIAGSVKNQEKKPNAGSVIKNVYHVAS